MISEIWEPQRNFAFLKLPAAGVQNLCALSSTSPHVYVVTAEGFFYQYKLNADEGGECVLLKQYSILDPAEQHVSKVDTSSSAHGVDVSAAPAAAPAAADGGGTG